jgi:hypothetical protein
MSSRAYETDDLFDSAQYFYSYAKEFNSSDLIKYSKTVNFGLTLNILFTKVLFPHVIFAK